MSFNATYPAQLNKLPPAEELKNSDFSDLLLKARIELAELKGASGKISNPLLLAAPLLVRESMESSQIENINTTVAKVLETQLLPEMQQKGPNKEVLNYRDAIYWGMEKLPDLMLTENLILGIHRKLLPENGGQFRREQNQIMNSVTGEILYTPPISIEISSLVGNLERYMNQNKDLDPLIRAAISHQYFESIHPFLDGNGRTGRILMILQLIQDQVLNLPILFISEYINKNKNEYYKLLRKVTESDSWREYIEFMLHGFYIQAKETKNILDEIVILNTSLKKELKEKHAKIYSIDLLESIFTYPIITVNQLAKEKNIHYRTSAKYLKEIEDSNILKSIKIGKVNFYVNKKLVALLTK